MKEKFIKGTNEKYSIREDGVVFSLSEYNGRKKAIMSPIKNRESKTIAYMLMKKEFSLSKLLIDNFGWKKCSVPDCENKVIQIRQIKCNDCLKKARRVSRVKYVKDHPEEISAYSKFISKKNTELLTKKYIAQLLKIPEQLLTEEIYNDHKKLLLFKREVVKEKKIHINKLK
jgi:hypothetical protein